MQRTALENPGAAPPENSSEDNARLRRNAARGAAKLMVAQAVTLLAGYVVAITLAGGLGPELYGDYGVILSVLLATELIARFGIPQASSKLIAEGPGSRTGTGGHSGAGGTRVLERTALTLTAAIYLTVTLIFVACAPLLARALDITDGTWLFRLAALDIPFYGMLFTTQHLLNGERRFGAESLGISLYGVSKALGIVALLYLGMSLEGALIVNVLASVVGFGFFASRLNPRCFLPSLAAARPLLRLALPTSVFVFGSQVLANLDLWCLKWLGQDLDRETVGFYVAATTVGRLPGVVHFVMAATLIPTVSRTAARAVQGESEADIRLLVRNALRFLLLLLLPGCTWLAVRSEELMLLIYRDEYVEGAFFQALLVFRFGFLTTLLMTMCSIQIALGRPGAAARPVLIAIPIGLAIIAAAIHELGAPGAAIGALATAAIAVALAAWTLWRTIGPLVPRRTVFSALLATAAVVGLAFVYEPDGWFLLLDLPLAMALVTLVLVAARELTTRDLHWLRRAETR